jgi:hypothetical protein
MTDRAALDAALLAAHDADDRGALVTLYLDAANAEDAAGAVEAACFFLTQAYVYALETGSPLAGPLNRRLAALGRDHLQDDLEGPHQ